jgi:hypothetical protein
MTQNHQARRNPLTLRNGEMPALASTGERDAASLVYDYELIAEEHRSVVMLSARRIKAKAERAKQDLLDIGKELVNVKARLAHGQFTEWIGQEFGMSMRTAQMMMNVWNVYGDKSETVSLLSDSALYLLSAPSVPETVREAVETSAKARGKSPTKAEVVAVIGQHRAGAAPVQETRQRVAVEDRASPARDTRGERQLEQVSAPTDVIERATLDDAGSHGAVARCEQGPNRFSRADELLALYRKVLSTLGEYGALTGKHTHTPAVRRALEPMIEELKNG